MGTYCDNETLRDRILSSTPDRRGLYEHEIAILVPALLEGATTKSFYGEGNLHFKYAVRFPQQLAQSMVDRGYLRYSRDDELTAYLRTKELRALLKRRDIRPGPSRRSARERVEECIPLDEVVAEVPYRFYILTDEGREALAENAEITEFPNGSKNVELRLLTDAKARRATKRELDAEIARRNSGKYALRPTARRGFWEMAALADCGTSWEPMPRVESFRDPVTVEVRGNGTTATYEQVSEVQAGQSSDILLIGTVDGETHEDGRLLYRVYDASSGTKLPDRSRLAPGDFQTVSLGLSFDEWKDARADDVRDDGWHLQFSSTTELGTLIAEHVLDGRGTLTREPNLLAGDATRNYEYVIANGDVPTYNYVAFLMQRGLLGLPAVLGTPASEVHLALRNRTDDPVLRIARADYASSLDHAAKAERVSEELLRRHGGDEARAKAALENHFGLRVLARGIYETYRYRVELDGGLKTERYRANLDEEVRRLEAQLHEDVNELKARGFMSARWVSEFTLYAALRRRFEDAVYQYHATWLGRQSLDIFIPSLSAAVEYQGAQHYSPVEFFGGEEGFEYRRRLDERKRELCAEQGVALYEWPYTTKVTDAEVAKLVSRIKGGHDQSASATMGCQELASSATVLSARVTGAITPEERRRV